MTWLTEEPRALLAVVEDERGRQWFRWVAGTSATSCPWAILGAAHANTVSNEDYECLRWSDLPPVFMVSPGISRGSFRAEWPQ